MLKNYITNSEEAFIYEGKHSTDKSLFSEISFSHYIRRPIDKFLEKPMRFLTLVLKTKLITPESTFRMTLCGMIIYKVLKSKDEIDLVFFLTFILFSIVTFGNKFRTIQNFIQPE